MNSGAPSDAVQKELDRILSSAVFENTPSTRRLLQYLCQKSLNGDAEAIKEYSIAIDVFGRSPDFDTRKSSIVRVEVTRLRQRLEKFYRRDESREAAFEIVLPPGSYVPKFLPRKLDPGAPDTRRPAARIWGFQPKWLLISIAGLMVAVAGAVLIPRGTGKSNASGSPPAKIVAVNAASAVNPAGGIRILAGLEGNPYVDRYGSEWQADAFFSGGSPAPPIKDFISGTYDSGLFQHARHGSSFSYAIPLSPGVYELRLFFAETQFGPDLPAGGGENSRVMQVSLNNRPLLKYFDICADTGGDHIADVHVFKDVQPGPDGLLHLDFRNSQRHTEDAIVSAIEIMPGVPGKMHPIRLLTRETWVTDSQGQTWGPDNYYRGGRLRRDDLATTQSSDRELHRAERWGNFSYVIPVAPGKYDVTLHFSETFFHQPSRRVFNVFSEGTMLLRDFDILREAGGPVLSVTRTFHGLVPNAQGKIVLSFVPVVNFASVNAIEVVDESR
jgi:hypothetical protein